MAKRDYVHTTDFNKDDFEEVFRRAKIFEEGTKEGKSFTHLMPGKVLASMFLKESTRTMTSAQSAIIRLGGGWTGLTGTAGTYLATGEEDIYDICESVAEVADLMYLRYNDVDPAELAKKISIPLINGMCGGDEHATGAIAMIYPWAKRMDMTGKTIGMYGMVSSSRPMKAIASLLGPYGAKIVIDPVVDVFRFQPHIEKLATDRGATIEYGPWEEWIGDVDAFIWVEGLPQTGEPEENVTAFNEKFHQFTSDDIKRAREDALFAACMPRMTTDGRLTMTKDCDDHPNNISFEALNLFVYVTMAIYTYLLDIDVE